MRESCFEAAHGNKPTQTAWRDIFKTIDHPLDPENKYLYHASVESPDMMNIYNGNVVFDDHGEAVVICPVVRSSQRELPLSADPRSVALFRSMLPKRFRPTALRSPAANRA